MARTFVRILKLLSVVIVPACLAISGAATPIIEFVYGVQWLPAADILLLLALLAAVRIWFELIYDYLVVLGRSSQVLLTQVLWGVTKLGAAGAALGQLVVVTLVVLPCYLAILRRVGVRPMAFLGAVAVPVAVGVLVWAGCRALSVSISSPMVAAFAAGGLTIVVIGSLALWRREDLGVLWAARKDRGT
jgi:PST family polysaccharide transporter